MQNAAEFPLQEKEKKQNPTKENKNLTTSRVAQAIGAPA
jgi:hypothetical protein